MPAFLEIPFQLVRLLFYLGVRIHVNIFAVLGDFCQVDIPSIFRNDSEVITKFNLVNM